jgi:cob(I)alamin adenosyltransferase
MKAYTGTGDKGETGLYDGTRLWKNDARVEAYGAVDELNSQIGVVRSIAERDEISDHLRIVQRDLFILGGDLAATQPSAKLPRVTRLQVTNLERIVDHVHDKLEPLRKFILPGGNLLAAELQVARSVCRRAERRVVALSREADVNPETVVYLNRLSSLLFDLGRLANKKSGVREEEWIHD